MMARSHCVGINRAMSLMPHPGAGMREASEDSEGANDNDPNDAEHL